MVERIRSEKNKPTKPKPPVPAEVNRKGTNNKQEDPETQFVDDAEIERRVVNKANAALDSATGNIIEFGRILNEEQPKIAHGRWQTLFKDYDGEDRAPVTFRFGRRKAEMLMKIAAHPILSKAKHVSLLPPSWGTLYQITRIPVPDEVLEKMVEDGTFSDIQRSEVEALTAKIKEQGKYSFERLSEALKVVIFFMDEWPDPHASMVNTVMHSIDDETKRAQMPAYLAKLDQLCIEASDQLKRKREEFEKEREEAREEEEDDEPKKSKRGKRKGLIH